MMTTREYREVEDRLDATRYRLSVIIEISDETTDEIVDSWKQEVDDFPSAQAARNHGSASRLAKIENAVGWEISSGRWTAWTFDEPEHDERWIDAEWEFTDDFFAYGWPMSDRNWKQIEWEGF